MYNTFIYGFTFLPWKLNNRGHFAVFATNIIFLLIKRSLKILNSHLWQFVVLYLVYSYQVPSNAPNLVNISVDPGGSRSIAQDL